MKKNDNMLYNAINLVKENLTKIALATFILGSSVGANAQIIHKEERFMNDHKWKLGLGVNMMDMNFNETEAPEGAETLMMAIPSKITLGYEVAKNLTIEAGFSMNKIEAGNFSNGELILADKDIYTVDGSLLYSLGGLFNLPVVDPYVKAGIGYLGFGDRNYTSASVGGGLNFWIADFGFMKDYRYPSEKWYSKFGLNVEVVGRKNISNDNPGSHAQYSAGIFYML